MEFAQSVDGQKMVERHFVSLSIKDGTGPQCAGGCPLEYLNLTNGARRLLLDFRFRPGSVILDNRALRDVKRLKDFLSIYTRQQAGAPYRLVLIGFSDNTGSPAENRVLSRHRVEAVASALMYERVANPQLEGLGQEMPVASNATREGRQKNRRVEVWIRTSVQPSARVTSDFASPEQR